MASAKNKKLCLRINNETESSPVQTESCFTNEKFLNDRRHLLNIFPEEVWDLVLKKVDNPKVLECLSNTSLFLRDLLAPQRVQFLFPTVLEIMGGNDNVQKNPISWLVESDMCPLKLRSVCQSWNKTIDNLIDNHPFHFYLKKDALTQQNLRLKQYARFRKHFVVDNWFYGGSDLHIQLPNHFDRTHGNADRNPFLGRRLSIQFDHEEEEINENVLPAVRRVLQKYGVHIFYFTVSVLDTPLSDSQLYSLIREFLQLTPNLKVFRYISDNTYFNGSEDELLNELSAQVNCNPLPTLPSLQMLATDDLPVPVFLELIRVSSNLTTLDISKMFLNQGYIMSTVPLPLLTTFSLNSGWETDILHLNRSTLNWPLTRLSLILKPHITTNDDYIPWEPVFNGVNNFSATLTHLQLELPQVKGAQDKVYPAQLTLNLPNLSNLSLVMHNVACLDFLLSAKDSLRVFEISIDLHQTTKIRAVELMQEAETGHAKIIKFLSCQSGFESNMWTIFPNLTQIKFTLQANIPWDYSQEPHFRKILGWSCSRRERVTRANLSAL